jgi:hypothetical protein
LDGLWYCERLALAPFHWRLALELEVRNWYGYRSHLKYGETCIGCSFDCAACLCDEELCVLWLSFLPPLPPLSPTETTTTGEVLTRVFGEQLACPFDDDDGAPRHRRCCCCCSCLVFLLWQTVHSVCRLAKVHSPPPSFTGTMWSACQALPLGLGLEG